MMASDAVIFVYQHLGFLISIGKSYLEPALTLEFLGMITDSMEMALSPHKEKVL